MIVEYIREFVVVDDASQYYIEKAIGGKSNRMKELPEESLLMSFKYRFIKQQTHRCQKTVIIYLVLLLAYFQQIQSENSVEVFCRRLRLNCEVDSSIIIA